MTHLVAVYMTHPYQILTPLNFCIVFMFCPVVEGPHVFHLISALFGEAAVTLTKKYISTPSVNSIAVFYISYICNPFHLHLLFLRLSRLIQ